MFSKNAREWLTADTNGKRFIMKELRILEESPLSENLLIFQ